MKYILNKTKHTAEVYEIPDNQLDGFLENPNLVELTGEQVQFYKACQSEGYTATKQEVLDVKKRVVIAPVVDLEGYKAQKLAELDRLSLQTAGSLSPAYQRQNAEVSIGLWSADPSAETVYSAEKSRTILENANRIAILCRDERYRVAKWIENATTLAEIDQAFSSNQYNTFQ